MARFAQEVHRCWVNCSAGPINCGTWAQCTTHLVGSQPVVLRREDDVGDHEQLRAAAVASVWSSFGTVAVPWVIFLSHNLIPIVYVR